jgi:hypothetical protein
VGSWETSSTSRNLFNSLSRGTRSMPCLFPSLTEHLHKLWLWIEPLVCKNYRIFWGSFLCLLRCWQCKSDYATFTEVATNWRNDSYSLKPSLLGGFSKNRDLNAKSVKVFPKETHVFFKFQKLGWGAGCKMSTWPITHFV